MPPRIFLIQSIQELFNLTQSTGAALEVGSEIRLEGCYQDDPGTSRQVILRRGHDKTDLAMKLGSEGWEIEILLPPAVYATFAELMHQNPTQCSFDLNHPPSAFQIGAISLHQT